MITPFTSLDSEQITYVIAYNVGAIWNLIVKWVDADMKDTPDYLKETLLIYFRNLMNDFVDI